MILVVLLGYIGVIWPLQGMPVVLQYISSILPATYPAEAMRAIMGRGLHLRINICRGLQLICEDHMRERYPPSWRTAVNVIVCLVSAIAVLVQVVSLKHHSFAS